MTTGVVAYDDDDDDDDARGGTHGGGKKSTTEDDDDDDGGSGNPSEDAKHHKTEDGDDDDDDDDSADGSVLASHNSTDNGTLMSLNKTHNATRAANGTHANRRNLLQGGDDDEGDDDDEGCDDCDDDEGDDDDEGEAWGVLKVRLGTLTLFEGQFVDRLSVKIFESEVQLKHGDGGIIPDFVINATFDADGLDSSVESADAELAVVLNVTVEDSVADVVVGASYDGFFVGNLVFNVGAETAEIVHTEDGAIIPGFTFSFQGTHDDAVDQWSPEEIAGTASLLDAEGESLVSGTFNWYIYDDEWTLSSRMTVQDDFTVFDIANLYVVPAPRAWSACQSRDGTSAFGSELSAYFNSVGPQSDACKFQMSMEGLTLFDTHLVDTLSAAVAGAVDDGQYLLIDASHGPGAESSTSRRPGTSRSTPPPAARGS